MPILDQSRLELVHVRILSLHFGPGVDFKRMLRRSERGSERNVIFGFGELE